MKEIGEILNVIKATLGHGKWGAWYAAQTEFQFSPTWARRCQKIAKTWKTLSDPATGKPLITTADEAAACLRTRGKPGVRTPAACAEEVARLRAVEKKMNKQPDDDIDEDARRQTSADVAIVVDWAKDIERRQMPVAGAIHTGTRPAAANLATAPVRTQTGPATILMAQPASPKTYTLDEAAKRLGVGKQNLENMFKHSPAFAPANKNAITEAELTAIAKELKVALTPAIPAAISA